MDKEKLIALIENFDREDDFITGIVFFDIKTGEEITSTYDNAEQSKIIIKVEQERDKLKITKLGKIQHLNPSKNKVTWSMASFERVIYASLRLKDDMYIAIEFDIKKSPTDAIEDILEIGINITHYL